jgi:hypothetical protein
MSDGHHRARIIQRLIEQARRSCEKKRPWAKETSDKYRKFMQRERARRNDAIPSKVIRTKARKGSFVSF